MTFLAERDFGLTMSLVAELKKGRFKLGGRYREFKRTRWEVEVEFWPLPSAAAGSPT